MNPYKKTGILLSSLKVVFVLAGILFLLPGCTSEDEPKRNTVSRTVLVYMLSDNDLGYPHQYDSKNIDDMMQVAAAGELNGGNLIVYRDGYDSNPQLLQITQDKRGNAEKRIIREYPNRNSASTEVMRSIIAETIELFPAKEYGLILWSHSTGWVPGNSSLALSPARREGPPTRSFGKDDTYYMELDELADAIPDRQFRFILSDACFMGSIECAYQLRNKTDYYMASAAEVMGAGMPYALTIPALFEYQLDLKKVGEAIYTHYNALSGAYRTATIGLLDCHKLETLAEAVESILYNHRGDAMPTLSNVQHFDRRTPYICFDLRDFFSQITTDEELVSLDQALSQTVLYQAATPAILGDVSVYTHCGLTCYVLGTGDATLDRYYRTLDWYERVYSTTD